MKKKICTIVMLMAVLINGCDKHVDFDVIENVTACRPDGKAEVYGVEVVTEKGRRFFKSTESGCTLYYPGQIIEVYIDPALKYQFRPMKAK